MHSLLHQPPRPLLPQQDLLCSAQLPDSPLNLQHLWADYSALLLLQHNQLQVACLGNLNLQRLQALELLRASLHSQLVDFSEHPQQVRLRCQPLEHSQQLLVQVSSDNLQPLQHRLVAYLDNLLLPLSSQVSLELLKPNLQQQWVD